MLKFHTYFYYWACFISGFAILAQEMIALRLLAPHFGTSIVVTGLTINCILLILAIGYFLGGKLADRSKDLGVVYQIMLMASVWFLLDAAVYRYVLQATVTQGSVGGVILTVVLLYGLPLCLLSMVGPYLIKFLSDTKAVGEVSGMIFALSTVGSLFGGLCTTFYFIPVLGSKLSIFVVGMILLATAIVGLRTLSKKSVWNILWILIPIVINSPYAESYVYETDSAYNHIMVKRIESDLYLFRNNEDGYASKSIDPQTKLSDSYYDTMLFPFLIRDVADVLILGNGAGTAMTQISYFFDARVDAVEIDSAITLVGKKYFGLKLNDKTNLYHQDARTFVRDSKKKYDAIIIDIYAQGGAIPFHVSTKEFFG
ncbi:MAG: putative membrane-bound spermidine synthase, partial [Candidatus Omnitrophota bacterium]